MPRIPKTPVVLAEGSIEKRAIDYISERVGWKYQSRLQSHITHDAVQKLREWDGLYESLCIVKAKTRVFVSFRKDGNVIEVVF